MSRKPMDAATKLCALSLKVVEKALEAPILKRQLERERERSRTLLAERERAEATVYEQIGKLFKVEAERDFHLRAWRLLQEHAQSIADILGAGNYEGTEDAARRVVRERNEAQANAAAAERTADRLRHGQAIEGDYVCPDSLRADEAERRLKDEKQRRLTDEKADIAFRLDMEEILDADSSARLSIKEAAQRLIWERKEAEARAKSYAAERDEARAQREDADQTRAIAFLQGECERLTNERDAAERMADRLRHGQEIESDYICPDSLRANEAERRLNADDWSDDIRLRAALVAADRLTDERDSARKWSALWHQSARAWRQWCPSAMRHGGAPSRDRDSLMAERDEWKAEAAERKTEAERWYRQSAEHGRALTEVQVERDTLKARLEGLTRAARTVQHLATHAKPGDDVPLLRQAILDLLAPALGDEGDPLATPQAPQGQPPAPPALSCWNCKRPIPYPMREQRDNPLCGRCMSAGGYARPPVDGDYPAGAPVTQSAGISEPPTPSVSTKEEVADALADGATTIRRVRINQPGVPSDLERKQAAAAIAAKLHGANEQARPAPCPNCPVRERQVGRLVAKVRRLEDGITEALCIPRPGIPMDSPAALRMWKAWEAYQDRVFIALKTADGTMTAPAQPVAPTQDPSPAPPQAFDADEWAKRFGTPWITVKIDAVPPTPKIACSACGGSRPVVDGDHPAEDPVTQQWASIVESVTKERDSLKEALTAVLEDRPMTDGTYPHLVHCNTDRRNPPGMPGVTCNCKTGSARAKKAEEQCEALRAELEQVRQKRSANRKRDYEAGIQEGRNLCAKDLMALRMGRGDWPHMLSIVAREREQLLSAHEELYDTDRSSSLPVNIGNRCARAVADIKGEKQALLAHVVALEAALKNGTAPAPHPCCGCTCARCASGHDMGPSHSEACKERHYANRVAPAAPAPSGNADIATGLRDAMWAALPYVEHRLSCPGRLTEKNCVCGAVRALQALRLALADDLGLAEVAKAGEPPKGTDP